MTSNPKAGEGRYAVGDEVTIWITGMIGDKQARVLRVNEDGFPDRLKVLDDPSWDAFTLKPGDFGIVRSR